MRATAKRRLCHGICTLRWADNRTNQKISMQQRGTNSANVQSYFVVIFFSSRFIHYWECNLLPIFNSTAQQDKVGKFQIFTWFRTIDCRVIIMIMLVNLKNISIFFAIFLFFCMTQNLIRSLFFILIILFLFSLRFRYSLGDAICLGKSFGGWKIMRMNIGGKTYLSFSHIFPFSPIQSSSASLSAYVCVWKKLTPINTWHWCWSIKSTHTHKLHTHR